MIIRLSVKGEKSMKCEKCGINNATTHIRSVINGKVSEINLCGYCAANNGIGKFGRYGIMDMLATAYKDIETSSTDSVNVMRCRSCGATFADIASKGLVGCPECYKVFHSELMPTIRRIHGKNAHNGKIPYSSAPRLDRRTQIESLRKQMNDAVSTENFELAATLRDRIKSIEEGHYE